MPGQVLAPHDPGAGPSVLFLVGSLPAKVPAKAWLVAHAPRMPSLTRAWPSVGRIGATPTGSWAQATKGPNKLTNNTTAMVVHKLRRMAWLLLDPSPRKDLNQRSKGPVIFKKSSVEA